MNTSTLTTPTLRSPRRFQSTSVSDVDDVLDRVARQINANAFDQAAVFAAAFDDEDEGGGLESTSAPRKPVAGKVRNLKEEAETQRGSTVERLLVVQYPTNPKEEAEWDSFESVFYVSNSSTQKAKGITRDNYLEVVEHLATESAHINAAIGLFRWIATNSGRVAASDDPQRTVMQQWQLNTVLINSTRVGEWSAAHMNACAVGNSHIVRQVADAYAVLFTGVPKSGLNQGVSNDAPIPTSAKDSYYQELTAQNGAFSSKVGRAAIEACKYLIDSIMETHGSTSFSNSTRRIITTTPLGDSYAAPTINLAFRQFQRATGILMPILEAPSMASNLLSGVGRYMLHVAIKDADETLVRRKVAAGVTVPDEDLGHSADLTALNCVISYSFGMSIPRGVARYISQAKEGEQVSLVALNTWASMWAQGMLTRGRKKGTRINGRTIRSLPRYVLPASKTLELTERRKDVGYYSEPGKSNKESIFIASNGTMQYLPPAADLALDNAVAYEQLLENALAVAFSAGTPMPQGSASTLDPVFELQMPGLRNGLSDMKQRLDKYVGSLQSYSWDYNTILTTSTSQADRVVAHSLVGATKPNAMFIADYMRKPFADSMTLMFPDSRARGAGERGQPADYGKDMRTSAPMLEMSPFRTAFALYDYLEYAEAVPSFKALLDEAAKALNITDLKSGEAEKYELGLYRKVLSPNLTITAPELDENDVSRAPSWFIAAMLTDAIGDAEGGPKSNLLSATNERNRTDSTSDAVEDDPRYFNASTSTLKEFSNVFQYLGGRVFQLMLKHILKADRKKFMVVDTTNIRPLPAFNNISTEAMPLAVMFGTYVDIAPKLYAEADEIIESNTSDDSFTANDVKLPGSKDGYSLFPHQLDGFKKLSRFPQFAILDVSPGGGKCLVGSSLVTTSQGLLTLSELRAMSGEGSEKPGFLPSHGLTVPALSGNRKVTKTFKRTGKTHRVTLQNGLEFQGLADHRLWTQDGWKRMDKVRNTDLVRVAGTNYFPTKSPKFDKNEFGITFLTEDLAELGGLLTAEAHAQTGGQVRIGMTDKEVIDRIASTFKAAFGVSLVPKCTVRGQNLPMYGLRIPARYASVIHQLVTPNTSQYKEVPKLIRMGTQKQQAAFLRGLIEGDGSVTGGSRPVGRRARLGFCTISPVLSQQVAVMLLNQGLSPVVVPKASKRYESRNGNARIGNKVTVRQPYNLYLPQRDIEAYAQKIGFISKRKSAGLTASVKFVSASKQGAQTTNYDVFGWENLVPAAVEFNSILRTFEEVCSTYEYQVPFGSQSRTCTLSIGAILREAGMGHKYFVDQKLTITRGHIKAIQELMDVDHVAVREAIRSKAFKAAWARLQELASYRWSPVATSAKTGITEEVFDLEVEEDHCYPANGHLSHNTTSILTDIGMMLHHKKAKRFLVMCPTRLAKNWIDDMRQHTRDNWNFIPINTAIYKKWGEDRLAELIEKAPPNTIVVVGNDWLSKTRGQQLVLGRHVERISTTVEMIKRFAFDYVGIDESHRVKRMHPVSSNIHRCVKSITTASSVKYLRLATGTLINNTLRDVVGQVALYSAAIFRTPQEFEEANREAGVGLGGRISSVYMNDAAKRAREHLSKYATVITTRRREWAFMLPIPIDTFSFVKLSESDSSGNALNPADDAHRMMYEALFKNTIEDIKSNPELMAMLTGKSLEEDDEMDDDEATSVVSDALSSAMDDQDDDMLEELSAALGPYLQRLEMAITDPIGDRDAFGNEFGSKFFGHLNMDNYKSAKVRKVIERLEKHYATVDWKPGQDWKKDDAVDHEGKRYLFKGKSGYRSIKAPAEDVDNWKPQAYGKVLVFCRYTRSVEAIFNALPEKLKGCARMFYGSLGTAWASLEEFKTSPVANPKDVISGRAGGVQILVANEQAISEGHNLQMASRMIRVEMPWAPGDLDQSSARIFRPDPSGKNARDYINLDWVIGEGTLEVAKLGCLISKILTKAQFDEADNPFVAEDGDGNKFGYKDLNKANLPTIKMSLKNIENIRWREDLSETGANGSQIDYLDEYRKFVQLQGADFLDMRRTRSARMIPIDPTPMPEGSSKMEFQPYVAAQKVVGHDDWGLVLLSEYLQNDKDPEARRFIDDKSQLKGQLVHTEFGNGIIIQTRTVLASGRKGADDAEGDPATRLSSVKIQLAGTDEIITMDADVVHLARNLNAQQIKQFAPKEFWVKSEADKRRVKAAEAEEAKENAKEGKRVRDEVVRERRELAVNRRTIEKAPIKKQVRKSVKDDFEDDEVSVQLYPVVYNGFFAVEGKSDTEDNASVLKKHGYRPFGDYVYIKIANFATFNAVMDYIEKKFYTSDSIYNRLVAAEESFTTGRGRKFDIALAPLSEFKPFYMMSHKLSRAKGPDGKPELKVYPMVIGNNLFFVADIETNPVARKLLSATITGATTKFGLADGMFIKFFSNKAALRSDVVAIRKSGLNVSNMDEFTEAFDSLKVGTPKPVEKERTERNPKQVIKAVPPAPVKKPVAKPVAKKAPVKTVLKKTATKAAPAKKTVAAKKPTRR